MESLKLKVAVVGDGVVGKTSLILRLTKNAFEEAYIHTIGTNFAVKQVDLPGVSVTMQLWDLAGTDEFRGIRSTFLKGASGVVYVYDITRSRTFRDLLDWKAEVEEVVPGCPSILLGNKLDLDEFRGVATRAGGGILEKLGASAFFETSAKTGENVEEAFRELAAVLAREKSGGRKPR
ncbi:MAG: Rab family GTPase [Promethearchaeota archaeon]